MKWRKVMNESGRKSKELEGITLLGNQGTKYDYGYNPEVLVMIILLSLTVQNLQVFVL